LELLKLIIWLLVEVVLAPVLAEAEVEVVLFCKEQ